MRRNFWKKVKIEMPKLHSVYKKLVKNTKKFKARDDIGVEVGDQVLIEETSPYSKTVTWIVKEKVSEEENK